MKDINNVSEIVDDEKINDSFVCRKLREVNSTLYIDDEMIGALKKKFNFEMTDIIKQKIKNTTNRVYNDYQKTFLENYHNNFACFIDDAIKFQKINTVYVSKTYNDLFKQINYIREGQSNPWDFQYDTYFTLSKVININIKLIVKKIDEHEPIIKDTIINNSYGICARAGKEMSTKQRKNAMDDARSKLLIASQQKKKKIFLDNFQKYLLCKPY